MFRKKLFDWSISLGRPVTNNLLTKKFFFPVIEMIALLLRYKLSTINLRDSEWVEKMQGNNDEHIQ